MAATFRTTALPLRKSSVRATNILALVMKATAIRRERQQLSELDDHLLHDIGITRADAQSEATRPVWNAPARWFS